MSITKTQHYVPRSYLKRFASNREALFVFDKLQNKVFKSNVINVACESYFYELPKNGAELAGIDSQAVEKLLADIEMEFSITVDGILKSIKKNENRRILKRKVINRKQKLAMAYFLTLQLLRTREQRERLTDTFQKMGEVLLSKMSDISPEKFDIVVEKQWVSLFQSQFMLSPHIRETFIQALWNHIWFIGVNKTQHPLYTSDHPVVRRAHYYNNLKSYSGIASPGIEIAFPLNPRYILVLCERQAFKKLKHYDCKFMKLNFDNIIYYNGLQVSQSNRQIYCPVDEFELAKNICAEHPEICKQDRDRIQVS